MNSKFRLLNGGGTSAPSRCCYLAPDCQVVSVCAERCFAQSETPTGSVIIEWEENSLGGDDF